MMYLYFLFLAGYKYNKQYNQNSYQQDQSSYQSSSGTPNNQIGSNGKFNVVCRYWKQGVCKHGDQCKFLHV